MCMLWWWGGGGCGSVWEWQRGSDWKCVGVEVCRHGNVQGVGGGEHVAVCGCGRGGTCVGVGEGMSVGMYV